MSGEEPAGSISVEEVVQRTWQTEMGHAAPIVYVLAETGCRCIRENGVWGVVNKPDARSGRVLQIVVMDYAKLKFFGVKIKLPFEVTIHAEELQGKLPNPHGHKLDLREVFVKGQRLIDLTVGPTDLLKKLMKGEAAWKALVDDVNTMVQYVGLTYAKELPEEE